MSRALFKQIVGAANYSFLEAKMDQLRSLKYQPAKQNSLRNVKVTLTEFLESTHLSALTNVQKLKEAHITTLTDFIDDGWRVCKNDFMYCSTPRANMNVS